MTFTDNAARLAGRVAVLIGWSPDAFWRATPTELAGVLDALAGRDGEGGAQAGGSQASAGDLARLKEMFPDG